MARFRRAPQRAKMDETPDRLTSVEGSLLRGWSRPRGDVTATEPPCKINLPNRNAPAKGV